MPRKERKWSHIKCSVKTTRQKKNGRQNRNKEQGKQIENIKEYGRN